MIIKAWLLVGGIFEAIKKNRMFANQINPRVHNINIELNSKQHQRTNEMSGLQKKCDIKKHF